MFGTATHGLTGDNSAPLTSKSAVLSLPKGWQEKTLLDGHRHLVILAPGAERLKQTSLLRAIQKSRQWTDMLINGEAGNVTDLAEKLGYKPSYVTRILSLNNLAPDIVESILAGTEPEGMSIAKITALPIPEDWNEQRRLYGFPVR